jgi:hypothetical protein
MSLIVGFPPGVNLMAKNIAKSKGNTARRSAQRNKGLPGGVVNLHGKNTLPSLEKMLANSTSLSDLVRKLRLARRWKVLPKAATGRGME